MDCYYFKNLYYICSVENHESMRGKILLNHNRLPRCAVSERTAGLLVSLDSLKQAVILFKTSQAMKKQRNRNAAGCSCNDSRVAMVETLFENVDFLEPTFLPNVAKAIMSALASDELNETEKADARMAYDLLTDLFTIADIQRELARE